MAFLRWLGAVILVMLVVAVAGTAFAAVLEGTARGFGTVGVIALVLALGWWARERR